MPSLRNSSAMIIGDLPDPRRSRNGGDAGATLRSSAVLVHEQRLLLRDAMAKVLSPGQAYALVDFPNFSNVGDSAIWLGARALLEDLAGRPPAYVATIKGFNEAALTAAVGSGPILINGGGNFGDLWPAHQDLREELLRRFPGRPIIQLPQSIKFHDLGRAQRFAELGRQHGNFTLMVRDEASREFAREALGIEAPLVPDCAVYLGPQQRRATPDVATVLLLRTDEERAGVERGAFGSLENSRLVDWIEEPANLFKNAKRRARVEALMRGQFSRSARRLTLFDRLARQRLERGLAMLSEGEAVITDRLHGHILSLLLDMPHVALDNSYGKVSGYIGAWNRNYEHLRLATSVETALAGRGELAR
ncbi:polysaccharide pyruvyl transferase family protein [Croceibacterium sp. LX-88]|uniref:Polysaccharide pyruvyl transferase family protein n=1 Tax=Croceibacterium selenioxidans TaxID=2838833 RepID=A0ABS5VZJ8_9SPHN|nr:polysaccharide pyruvyl transferase family protein [Croceibacterium selenioxidans]MBT2132814.1 polysaccharide pyruvyl transferase family protein [Croceibacterium selenioxidans]